MVTDRHELPRFHLAIAVHELHEAERFYAGLLGCEIGRRSERWIDFDLFGHQLTVHQLGGDRSKVRAKNPVDGDAVPVPHFGVILEPAHWRAVAERIEQAQWPFVIAPKTRFEGETGEQGTFFVADPSANMMEFKSFADDSRIFAR